MTNTDLFSSFYGEGDLDVNNLTPARITSISSSGFTDVIFGLFHVTGGKEAGKLGEVFYNDTALDLSAKSDKALLSWAKSIQALKAAGIEKVYFSFGGGEVGDYQNISNIMKYKDPSNKTGPYIPESSFLYQNFLALNKYFPMVDGIDVDEEEGVSADVITAFGNMAFEVGFSELTYAPPYSSSLAAYTAAAISTNTYAANHSKPSKGFVTRLNLQCYGGIGLPDIPNWHAAATQIGQAGQGDKPSVLIGGSSVVYPNPSDLNLFFKQFDNAGADGGFLWEYSAMKNNLSESNKAMLKGLS
jgi:hypothetical protein